LNPLKAAIDNASNPGIHKGMLIVTVHPP